MADNTTKKTVEIEYKKKRLTEDDIYVYLVLRQTSGDSTAQLAKRFGVTPTVLDQLPKREFFNNILAKFRADGRLDYIRSLPLDINSFPTLLNERWAHYKWGYYISTLGRVGSYKRRGRVVGAGSYSFKIMKPGTSGRGREYLIATLQSEEGETEYKLVHRMVLESFVGPCPEGCEGCHTNSIRTDNRLENLRWDTRASNTQDRVNKGSSAGSLNSGSKLKEEEVWDILFYFILRGVPTQTLASQYDVHISCIQRIVYNAGWKSVNHKFRALYV